MDPLRWRPSPTPNFNAAAALPPGLEVARARLTQLAGTPAAKEVVRLLTGALPNLTEDAGKPLPTAQLPGPVERLASKLASFGVQGRDSGAVLRELRDQVSGAGRGLTPERMDALSLASGKGFSGASDPVPANMAPFWGKLDADQKTSIGIQQAISKQGEAAALLTNIFKAKDQADNQIQANFK